MHSLSRCWQRKAFKPVSIAFSILLAITPVIVLGDQHTSPADNGTLQHLEIDYLRIIVGGLFTIIGVFMLFILKRFYDNFTTLFNNQRKFAQWLTAITTAHNINHHQQIEMPELDNGHGGD